MGPGDEATCQLRFGSSCWKAVGFKLPGLTEIWGKVHRLHLHSQSHQAVEHSCMPCKGPEEPCKWWVAEAKGYLVVRGEGSGEEREREEEERKEGEGEGGGREERGRGRRRRRRRGRGRDGGREEEEGEGGRREEGSDRGREGVTEKGR